MAPRTWSIRAATERDDALLRDMLLEAAYWRSTARRPPCEQALQRPDLAKILHRWGKRDGDTGVVAISPVGRPIGAAWYRYWTDEDHSYGYVDAGVPELGIGVLPEFRRRGVGRALMEALIGKARAAGLRALSLSVERDNGALGLYRALRFIEVATVGNSFTMVLNLGGEANAD